MKSQTYYSKSAYSEESEEDAIEGVAALYCRLSKEDIDKRRKDYQADCLAINS